MILGLKLVPGGAVLARVERGDGMESHFGSIRQGLVSKLFNNRTGRVVCLRINPAQVRVVKRKVAAEERSVGKTVILPKIEILPPALRVPGLKVIDLSEFPPSGDLQESPRGLNS